jgi:hypothetical protein
MFDLDLEVVPAKAPSADEIRANPLAAQEMEAHRACTPPTIDTYTFGVARCPTCC